MNVTDTFQGIRAHRPNVTFRPVAAGWWLMLLLLPVLSGCAPGVRGTLSNRPLDIDFLDPDSVVEVMPGQTFYITNSSFYADPRYFGYSPEDANDLLGMRATRVGESVRRNVTSEFDLLDVQAPEGWNVALYRVDATREIVDEDRQHDVYYFRDNIQLFVSVGVPDDAQPGSSHRLFLTVVGKDDVTDRIVLVVRVMELEG